MKLNDEVIADIAKLVQLAILTGTDVVDHLRMVRLQEEGGELFLTEEYIKTAKDNISKMLSKVEENQQN